MIEFEKDEHIIFEIRRHWLVFVTEIAIVIIFALLPLFVFSMLRNSGADLSFLVGVNSLFLFFYSLWLIILWLVGVVFWTNYYLDVWVVTSKKIIDLEQHGLFKRRESFLHLDKIQDVTIKISGLLPTLLNYGNIVVQTAGVQGEFLIKGIPNPKFLHQKINEAIKIYREELENERNKIN